MALRDKFHILNKFSSGPLSLDEFISYTQTGFDMHYPMP